MNKLLGMLCATVCTLGFAAIVSSAEVNPQACQQVMENSCTKCHGIKRTCTTLEKTDDNWPAIVADMAKRGKLSQEVQDQALACVTSADGTVKGAFCPQK